MTAHRFPQSLVLIRHGQTSWNAQGRYQGHSDPPLNETGHIQASRCALHLSLVIDKGIIARSAPIFCSPLQRAKRTADIVAEHCKMRMPVPISALMEKSFGVWEGLTPAEVKSRYPEQRRARKLDRWNCIPEGGESFAQLNSRVENWLATTNDSAVIVAHAGTIQILAKILKLMDTDQAMEMKIAQDYPLLWHNGKLGPI